MPRRLTACLMALLLCFAALPAHDCAYASEGDSATPSQDAPQKDYLKKVTMLSEEPPPEDPVKALATLSQYDDRFYSSDFNYNNNYLRYGGCYPSSVTNALIAALDVTSDELAMGMLWDVMHLLTNGSPATRQAQLAYLQYLDFTAEEIAAGDEQYPALSEALIDFGGSIHYQKGYVEPEHLAAFIEENGNRRAVFHGSFARSEFWPYLCEMADVLFATKHWDATIVVAGIGAGTVTTRAPFRSGEAGHYLSLYFPIRDFSTNGAFYVLDSFPRSLEDEPYGLGQEYSVTYDFIDRQKYATSLDGFNERFSVTRVKPTIVRVDPINDAYEDFNDAINNDADMPLYALLPHLSYATFFGTSHIFLIFPGEE